MSKTELSTRSNNDAVVTMPSLVARQEGRANGFRSRVTRYGNTSLEIEIPREGLTGSDRCGCTTCIPILVILSLIGIPLTFIQTSADGAAGLLWLLLVVIPLLVIIGGLAGCKERGFTHISLKITSTDCCLSQKGITWESFFQILCDPAHFDDLESAQIIETAPRERHQPRRHRLKAKIEIDTQSDGPTTEYIKLGSIEFAHHLSSRERRLLIEQINIFLQETR